jgi:hypothetical protein
MTYSTEAANSAYIPSNEREFIRIDLSNFDQRREEITKLLMEAATQQGFFYGKKKKKRNHIYNFLLFIYITLLIYCFLILYSCESWDLYSRYSVHVPHQP